MRNTTTDGVVVRMGAHYWDAAVTANGTTVNFNFRTMDRKARAAFHRELMNAVRERHNSQQRKAA